MIKFLRRLFSNSQNRKVGGSAYSRRLELLGLEDRITPATIIVNSLADNTTADAFTTLREAITTANASADADTIEFASSLFTGGAGTITLASSLPAIVTATTAGTLSVTGPGSSSLTISANNGNFRVFSINSGGNLTISGVTVSGSKITSSGTQLALGTGGAFDNYGILSISDSTLSGNSTSYRGGAIFNRNSATLSIANSIISGNSSNAGGAIFAYSGVTITSSTISGNSASYRGGAIASAFSCNAIVSNSTISNNIAGDKGGGISNQGSTNWSITNSTISGNTAGDQGGGVETNSPISLSFSTVSGNSAGRIGGGISNGGPLTISNSTIAGNSASSGGGLYSFTGQSPRGIDNTIIGDNPIGGDFAGTWNFSASNTLMTQGSYSGVTTVTSTQLNLGVLQNNGGPTATHALITGSVAISAPC